MYISRILPIFTEYFVPALSGCFRKYTKEEIFFTNQFVLLPFIMSFTHSVVFLLLIYTEISLGQFSRGQLPRGNHSGVIVWGEKFLG